MTRRSILLIANTLVLIALCALLSSYVRSDRAVVAAPDAQGVSSGIMVMPSASCLHAPGVVFAECKPE